MDEKLGEIRNDIDAVDRKIIRLLEGRVNLAKQTYKFKKELGMPACDPKREEKVMENVKSSTSMKPEFVESIYRLIIAYCKDEETK